jgi:hypothetical protein
LESSERGYESGGWQDLPLRLLSLAFGVFLDAHVFKFAGFENLAALETLHKLGIFVTADDLHARMLARFLICVLGMRERL